MPLVTITHAKHICFEETLFEHAPIVVEIRGNPSKPILSYSLLYVNTLSYRIKGTDEGGNHPVPVNSIKPLLSFK